MVSFNPCKPYFAEESIPVFLASNDSFIPYLGVALHSLIKHASPQRKYDVVILTEYICEHNQELLRSMATDNVFVRILNISAYTQEVLRKHGNIFYASGVYNIANYYRMFIPQLVENYRKIIYLDADIVLLKDVGLLFDTDLQGRLLGATADLYMKAAYKNDDLFKYLDTQLHMQNADHYFQSGVLVMDTEQMKAKHITDQLLQALKEIKRPYLVDQDLFNCVCENQVLYIDNAWNYDWNCEVLDKRFAFKNNMEESLWRKWHENCQNKSFFVLHFAGAEKPWHHPLRRHAEIFWQYARQTPFYEAILYAHIHRAAQRPAKKRRRLLSPDYFVTLWHYYYYKIASQFTFGQRRTQMATKKEELHKEVRRRRAEFKK